MCAPLHALDAAEERHHIGSPHFQEDELEGVRIRHEAAALGERGVDHRKQIHGGHNLAVAEHRHGHLAQVVHEQRQAVVAFVLKFPPGALERAQNVRGPAVRPVVEQVLPRLVRYAVDRLPHARTV